MSRGNGNGTFSAPIEIVDHDLEPTGFIGPEIESKGDTVYITFICGISNDAIMIKKSFDGGLTFSDTIRVSPNDNNFQFGFNRLSILDLSENGNQPIHSSSGRYTMVFNGEIYNHLELRKLLPSKKYLFQGIVMV